MGILTPNSKVDLALSRGQQFTNHFGWWIISLTRGPHQLVATGKLYTPTNYVRTVIIILVVLRRAA